MRNLVAVALALPVLALAACGDSDPSPKDQITSIIKDVGAHPKKLCTDYAATSLLSAAGGQAACLKAASAPSAAEADIKVNSVTVNGDKATASITSKSGSNTLDFEKQDGDWKLVSSKSS